MSDVTETFPQIPAVPPEAPGKGRKRRWSAPQKILLVVLFLGVAAVFAGYGFLSYTEGKIERIEASELTSLNTAPIPEGDSVNFLIVGVDDRSSIPDDWEDTFGDFRGRRTDVMMIAHLTPESGIQLLSIPRDLKASIAGHGTNRVNASYVFGGPDLLVETIQNEIGIPIVVQNASRRSRKRARHKNTSTKPRIALPLSSPILARSISERSNHVPIDIPSGRFFSCSAMYFSRVFAIWGVMDGIVSGSYWAKK